ncbi:MAG TPA: VWA domain-containing protein [Gammaproteobacteria bacterium]|nr:VWA domain-containing protein [Gammaproteobacteria bacterium]
MNGAWTALHWYYPWALLALPLPWLLAGARRHRATAARRLRAYADPHLLATLLSGPGGPRRRPWLLLLAWSLAVLALAGPYWDSAPPPRAAEGRDIAVILDISPSMAVADLAPSRLVRAQRELKDFLAALEGDRLGLIAFSANAYPVLPLTSDRQVFARFTELLEPGLTTAPGSNLNRALELAGQLLARSPARSRAALLLSDGGFHDEEAFQGATRLARANIPLLVLGVGTAAGGPVPGRDGRFLRGGDGELIYARLERERLVKLAATAQGAYFDLRSDDSDWQALLTALHRRTEPHVFDQPAASSGRPLFPWPLAASLVLFLWCGWRRPAGMAALIVAGIALLPLGPAKATPWTAQQALEAYKRGDFETAARLYETLEGYRAAMGLGAAAYRLQQWEAALSAFTAAAEQATDPGAKARALYNRGNALARLGRFEAASAAYQAALALESNLSQAALNLALVHEFLDARHRGERPPDTPPEEAPPGAAGKEGERFDLLQSGREERPGANRQRDGTAATTRQGRGTPQAGPTPRHSDDGADAAQTAAALAQWRAATADQTAGRLGALDDNSAGFLRERFLEQDRGTRVLLVEDKPW